MSIRAVADGAGVTPPSIYLHFADKNALMAEVCRGEFATFHATLVAAIEGVDDPLDRLRAMGHAYVNFGLANPETYRVLFMHKPDQGPASEDLPELLAEGGFGLLVDEVQRCIDAGLLAGETADVAVQLWTGVHGVTSLLISHPNFPWPDRTRLFEQVLDTYLRGLAP